MPNKRMILPILLLLTGCKMSNWQRYAFSCTEPTGMFYQCSYALEKNMFYIDPTITDRSYLYFDVNDCKENGEREYLIDINMRMNGFMTNNLPYKTIDSALIIKSYRKRFGEFYANDTIGMSNLLGNATIKLKEDEYIVLSKPPHHPVVFLPHPPQKTKD